MVLFINTADVTKVSIAIVKSGKILAASEFQARYRQAERLLPAIEKLLRSKNLRLKNIDSVGVVAGPGPFTALRIGIAVANTLAWALHIPAFGIRLEALEKSSDAGRFISSKAKSAKLGTIIEPFYGKEPNITLKPKP